MRPCPRCEASGYDPEPDYENVVEAVCCGMPNRWGECCGEPEPELVGYEPVPTPCRDCGGRGWLPEVAALACVR